MTRLQNMESARFSCTHPGCNASYRRKEHLVRHSARHSRTRLYTCPDCEARFDRSDTLRRHMKVHLKPDETTPRVAKACDRCHAQKSKCDGANPCGICTRKRLECTFERDDEPERTRHSQRTPPVEHRSSSTSSSTTAAINQHEGSEPARKRPRHDAPLHREEIPGRISLPQTGPVLPHPSIPVLSTASEQEVRAELHCRETKLQEDAARFVEQAQQSKTKFLLEDLYVPSASDENKSQYIEDEDLADSFVRSIDVDHYVSLYFAHFHPFWPFIMKTAFAPRTEPRILVLATVMTGLWITGENRLRKIAWAIHGHLHVILKKQMSRWCIQPTGNDTVSTTQQPNNRSTRTRWPLATYQAILLFTIFSMTAHDPEEAFEDNNHVGDNEADILVRTRPIFSNLVRTCRAQGVFRYPAMLNQGSPEDPFLFAWTNLEELKYFALSLYKASALFNSLTKDMSAATADTDSNNAGEENDVSISLSELEFPVPDNGYLWCATSGRDFFRRREMRLRDPVRTSTSSHNLVENRPWISDILGNRAGVQVSPAQKRRAWMSLGPFLGYVAGVNPS